MDWWIIILIGLCVGLPLLFSLAAFVIGCFEKIEVRMFEPADLPQPGNYSIAMVRRAMEYGFLFRCTGRHVKFKEKIQGTLLLAPDAMILVIVGEGKLAAMPSKKTILHTKFADGSLLMTVDEAGVAELDPATQREVIMNADFNELLNAHIAKLQGRTDLVPFPAAADWNTVDELYRERAERIVGKGYAKWVGGEKNQFRYTPVTSFRVTVIHSIKEMFRPKNLARSYQPRPG